MIKNIYMNIQFKNTLNDNLEDLIVNLKKLVNYEKDIVLLCKCLVKTINNNNKILFCGNGGSAAESQHFAAEFVSKFMHIRRPLPALALTTDSSILTSIANDFNFKYVFSKQIQALGKKEDILVCLSTSGKSQNILEAIKAAKKRNIKTFLITSEKFKKKIKHINVIKLPSKRTDRNQEIQLFFFHYIIEILEKNFL
jgi:D-sedoheptulose 7-phosphate isomerase